MKTPAPASFAPSRGRARPHSAPRGGAMARRIVTWIVLLCFLATRTTTFAGPHEEGTAAGQAANPTIRGTINTPSAASTVPGYTATPPETVYYGQPGLSGPAHSRLAACAALPNDPVCQACHAGPGGWATAGSI